MINSFKFSICLHYSFFFYSFAKLFTVVENLKKVCQNVNNKFFIFFYQTNILSLRSDSGRALRVQIFFHNSPGKNRLKNIKPLLIAVNFQSKNSFFDLNFQFFALVAFIVKCTGEFKKYYLILTFLKMVNVKPRP